MSRFQQSAARNSFRPTLEVLEGRAVPSGMAPTRAFIPGMLTNQVVVNQGIGMAGSTATSVIEIESHILKRWPT